MNEVILALEGFGGELGCIAATVTLTPDRLDALLALADAYRAAPKGIIRMVFANDESIRWFVEDDDQEEIADFTQTTSGYKVVEKHPGEANLSNDVRTIHLTAGKDTEVDFTWRAVIKHTDDGIETIDVPEAFFRKLRTSM